VIWESPKRRAARTAEIIREVFEGKEIPIFKTGIKDSLRDVKAVPEFFDQMKRSGASDWMKEWAESDDLPEGMEGPGDVKKRTERIITYLERIARAVHPEGNKKFHFIIPSHEETVKSLLDEALGEGAENQKGPRYGETVRVDIKRSEPGKDAGLEVTYGDRTDKLGFNTERRIFFKKDE